MTLTDFINVRSEYAELYANKKEKYTQKEHIEKIDNVSIFFGIVEVILSFSVCCLIILTVLCLLEKPSHVQNVLLLTIVFGILFIILRKLNTKITTYRENTIEKIQKHAIEKAKEKISKKYEVEFYGVLDDGYYHYQLHKDGKIHIPAYNVHVYEEDGIEIDDNTIKKIKKYVFKIKYIKKDGTYKYIFKEFPIETEVNTKNLDLILNESDLKE